MLLRRAIEWVSSHPLIGDFSSGYEIPDSVILINSTTAISHIAIFIFVVLNWLNADHALANLFQTQITLK
jgi:hypothetical protein